MLHLAACDLHEVAKAAGFAAVSLLRSVKMSNQMQYIMLKICEMSFSIYTKKVVEGERLCSAYSLTSEESKQ